MVQILHNETNTNVNVRSDTSAAVPFVCSVPQGWLVGPLLFIAYIEDIKDTIDIYVPENDLYADDTQLLSHMCLAEIQRRRVIENFVIAIQDGCASRHLQLSPDKTEAIWFGSKFNMAKLSKTDISLRLE